MAPIVGGILAAIVAKISFGYRKLKNWLEDQLPLVKIMLARRMSELFFLYALNLGGLGDSAIFEIIVLENHIQEKLRKIVCKTPNNLLKV